MMLDACCLDAPCLGSLGGAGHGVQPLTAESRDTETETQQADSHRHLNAENLIFSL
jgi:hypothetical protein